MRLMCYRKVLDERSLETNVPGAVDVGDRRVFLYITRKSALWILYY